MPKKDRLANPAKKRNFLGPKVRGRPGREPKPSAAEQDSIVLARHLGRSALGRAVQRYLEGLDATKPIYRKEDDGEGHEAYIPQEDIPDHAMRLRAADALCDRFGLPKKVETSDDDPMKLLLGALIAAASDKG